MLLVMEDELLESVAGRTQDGTAFPCFWIFWLSSCKTICRSTLDHSLVLKGGINDWAGESRRGQANHQIHEHGVLHDEEL